MSCLLEWERPCAGRIHFGALAKAFADAGHEVVGVVPARRETAAHPAPFARLYAVPPFTEGYAGQGMRAACHLAVQCWAILREKPDAIYVRFRSCAPFACAAGRLLGRGAPVIGEHNTWASTFLKVSGYSSAIHAVSRWSQLLAARCSHRIRTSTRHLKEILVARGIGEDRIFVAGMGADLDRFRPRPREESCVRTGLDPACRYVGYAGSLNRWQGVDVLVESFRLLVDAFPQVRAVILGDGPQAANLRRQAALAGLDGRLVFKGNVPHEHVPDWINCFDVGIGALRTQAQGRLLATPMKLVEYAACGTPSVTASAEGAEVLAQRGAVVLVPSDDPSATAEAIARLLRDPAPRERMGLIARKVAEESLSWTAVGREILKNFPPCGRSAGRRRPVPSPDGFAQDLRLLADAALSPARTFAFLHRRHGIYLPRAARSIWVVGAHPGAFEAAGSLIQRLRSLQPQHRLVVMSADPSTFDWLLERYAGDTVLPFPRDAEAPVERFFAALAPRLVVLLGQDATPGNRWARKMSAARIPVALVDLGSDRPPPDPNLPEHPSLACAQDEAGAARLESAGVPGERICTCGRLEFDAGSAAPMPSVAYLRRELGIADAAIVILAEQAGPGEEALLLSATARIRRRHPDAILVLEPRRRRQIHQILQLARQERLTVQTRSRQKRRTPAEVLVLDKAAELPALHALASLVLAGGSFLSGHPVANPVCAARFGKPVVVGPAADGLSRLFLQAGAAAPSLPEHLADTVAALLADSARRQALADRAIRLLRDNEGASQRIWTALAPFLPFGAREPDGQGWRVKTRVDRLSETAFGTWLAAKRSGRRIDTWEALGKRLGHPRAILCLGNGPSSEDPQIRTIPHDCLMRINWRWKTRGFLDRPDLVMVGHPLTMQRVGPCVFGFGRIEWERAMLIRHLLSLKPSPPEFFTLERVSSIIRPEDWHTRPTNGALMVALAAALRPAELAIAGYDLFRHADGRYPGDLHSQNEPAQVHDRDVDVEVIGRALDSFSGKVSIHSDLLRAALEERARGRTGT